MTRGTREVFGHLAIGGIIVSAVLAVDDRLRTRLAYAIEDVATQGGYTDQFMMAFLGVGAGLLLLMVTTLRR